LPTLDELIQKLSGAGSVSYDDMRALEEAIGGLTKMQYAVQTGRKEHPGESGVLDALPTPVLAQLDRYTHAAEAAKSNPFNVPILSELYPGVADLIHGGIMTGVFGASELGKAAGLGKAMSAATRASGLGNDINFFDQTDTTSPPSLDNITSVIKGYFRGATDRTQQERRKMMEALTNMSPMERMVAVLGGGR
jgi:hypothetical protein